MKLVPVAIVLLGVAGAAWWLVTSGAVNIGSDFTYRFISPSETRVLALNETCSLNGCERSIGLEDKSASTTLDCTVPIAAADARFGNAYPDWSADEQSVDITFRDGINGAAGTFKLNLTTDCTA